MFNSFNHKKQQKFKQKARTEVYLLVLIPL